MSASSDADDLSGVIATYLPHLRRFARAITGSQGAGDAYAAATLQAIVADQSAYSRDLHPKVALYKVFNSVWNSSGATLELGPLEHDARAVAAQQRLKSLTPKAREALLLRTLEDFDDSAIGAIMDLSVEDASELASIGAREVSSTLRSKILIIEDEALIAMDLQAIVEEMGHSVTELAATREDAVKAAIRTSPELVLADIHLADNSSGIDAVQTIMDHYGATPVIFITAYPERLLSGERPEPTFLIPKPFKEAEVRMAIEQALFFRDASLVTL